MPDELVINTNDELWECLRTNIGTNVSVEGVESQMLLDSSLSKV